MQAARAVAGSERGTRRWGAAGGSDTCTTPSQGGATPGYVLPLGSVHEIEEPGGEPNLRVRAVEGSEGEGAGAMEGAGVDVACPEGGKGGGEGIVLV